MIRKLLFLLLAGVSFIACNDDDEIFDVPVEFQRISFEAVPGGAVMRYKLPDDLDIYRVRARYLNAYGEEMLKDGSYLSDSILLSGFTEARTDVPVRLSFLNKDMLESVSVERTFNTEASASVALFDNLTVNPYWGGFNVTYSAPESVDGTIHVFYIGTNPKTHEPDSILMGSYPIVEGGDTLNFEVTQSVDQLDVVVRTDDYDGHRVKLNVYEDIPSLEMATLSPSEFDFSFTGTVQERPEYGFGEKYLFDGKKKGDGYRLHILKNEKRIYDTFVAGPEAFGERFIFDLGMPKVPAALYAYVFLQFHSYYPEASDSDKYIGDVWSGYYPSRLPCKAKVYGVSAEENPETVDLSTCALLYTLDDDDSWDNFKYYSWCKDTDCAYSANTADYSIVSDAEFEAQDPILLRMVCNYTGEKFQYLVLVVEDTYHSGRWGDYEDNGREYVTFDEIEVLVQAE